MTTTGSDALITWTPSQYSGFRGTAGGVELFSIHYHTRSKDPKYFLSSELPGARTTMPDWKDDDEKKLMAVAEKVLAAWLAKVTGGAQ